jgi:prevent-host-death family protein
VVKTSKVDPLHGRAKQAAEKDSPNVFSLKACILIAPNKVPTMGSSMLDITKDIQSLTTFRRRSGEFLKQLKKSKRPVVLTVKGKAAAVVQDAEAYQRLLDIAASANVEEGIRQGLDDVAHGRTRPAKTVFDEIRHKHGIPR